MINGDLWPVEDSVCHRVSYNFKGCDYAVRLTDKRACVVQAGGCVGVWPRYLHDKWGFRDVYTFEVSRDNFDLMRKNLKSFPRIKMFNAALSNEGGWKGIRANSENCGDYRTKPGDDVIAMTIDSLNLEPDLIYLDIQGDEYLALQGAKDTIDRCSPVIGIEHDPKMLPYGNPIELLAEYGYFRVGHFGQDLFFTRK